MSEPPDWAIAVPSTAGVHPSSSQQTDFTRPFTQAQLVELGAQFIEQFLKRVVLALVGTFIPGGNGAAFTQLQQWADSVVEGGSDLIATIFGALTGGGTPTDPLTDLSTALQHIPFLNVLGIGGPGNIGASLLAVVNSAVGGAVGQAGDNASFADLFNTLFQVSSNAALGGLGWDILGIRNNKSLSSGMLPSSRASLPLSQAASGSSATTFGVTASTAITLYENVHEAGEVGVVRWMGQGTTNITGFFLNIYQMNTTTGDRTCVYTSGDIKGSLSASMTTSKHVLSTPISQQPGEVYGYELALTGIGTHTVVGEPTWIHDDPDVYPRRLSSVRNGGSVTVGAVQTSGTITYASNIPFIEVATALTGVVIPHSPEIVQFNTAGDFTLPIPSWANTVQIVAVGSGGGGHQGGTYGFSGEGADAGLWAVGTWLRTTDFTGAPSIAISVGFPGVGGGKPGTTNGVGTSGLACSASITGHSVTAPGGAGGDEIKFGGDHQAGASPGDQTYDSVPYTGAPAQSTSGASGASPGGGGAGGDFYFFQLGGDGGTGAVWVRFKQ